MAYLEKNFQTDLNKWCKHFIHGSTAFELKLARSNSLPFDTVKEHQSDALYHAKHNKIIYKIPDLGTQNPFDSLVLCGVPAYVVVMFNGKEDDFFMIDIDKWIKEKEISDRKSLTKERAKEIGVKCSMKLGLLLNETKTFSTAP